MFLVTWPGGSWEATAMMAGAAVALYITTIWMALVFWTARDIHQRTRSLSTQLASTALVLFAFLPGHWLYLILRPRLTLADRYERSLEAEAVLLEIADRSSCPKCTRRVKDDFLVCPSCRAELKEPCVECSRPLNYSWIACPGCGRDKAPKEVAAAAATTLAPGPVLSLDPSPRQANQPASPLTQFSGGTPGS